MLYSYVKEVNTMSFKKWLKQFENVDHAIGDLAKDVAVDKAFPSKVVTMDSLTDYLYSKNASEAAITTAKNVFIFYALDEGLAHLENGDLVWQRNN